jgi:hypothetical protein
MGPLDVVKRDPIGSASNAKDIVEVTNDARDASIKAVNFRAPND